MPPSTTGIAESGEVDDAAAPPHTHSDGTHAEHYVPRLTVLPMRHTKVLHLIRHGEGFHNVAGGADPAAYRHWDWEDAHLTPAGWEQALALRAHLAGLGPAFRPGLVVVSPLTRTLETAAGVFGTGPWQPPAAEGGSGAAAAAAPPLMLAQEAVEGRRAAQEAIASASCPPILAWEGCREHLGVHPCDRRRPMADIAPSFPAVDFSLLADDADTLWHPDVRESSEDIMRRGLHFMHWLLQRPEREIAVVSHSGFLRFFLKSFGHNAATVVQGELHRWFENCEMRSVVVCDEGGGQHRHPDLTHFRGGDHSGKGAATAPA